MLPEGRRFCQNVRDCTKIAVKLFLHLRLGAPPQNIIFHEGRQLPRQAEENPRMTPQTEAVKQQGTVLFADGPVKIVDVDTAPPPFSWCLTGLYRIRSNITILLEGLKSVANKRPGSYTEI